MIINDNIHNLNIYLEDVFNDIKKINNDICINIDDFIYKFIFIFVFKYYVKYTIFKIIYL